MGGVQHEKPETYWWKKVEYKEQTTKWFEYTLKTNVKAYSIWWHKDFAKPSCSCQHGSLWGTTKKEEICWHIKAVTTAIRMQKRFVW